MRFCASAAKTTPSPVTCKHCKRTPSQLSITFPSISCREMKATWANTRPRQMNCVHIHNSRIVRAIRRKRISVHMVAMPHKWDYLPTNDSSARVVPLARKKRAQHSHTWSPRLPHVCNLPPHPISRFHCIHRCRTRWHIDRTDTRRCNRCRMNGLRIVCAISFCMFAEGYRKSDLFPLKTPEWSRLTRSTS